MTTQPLESKTSTMTDTIQGIGRHAREAARQLARSPARQRDQALCEAAGVIRRDRDVIMAANANDLRAARARGIPGALLDRLMLDAERIDAIAMSLEQIADMADPLGVTLAEWPRPNGLHIERISVPLGVIAIIFESRPNVTADAGGLCLKSGNAAILRCGSDCVESARVIARCLASGLIAADLPATAVQLLPTQDREAVGLLLGGLQGSIDVVVPRGGRRLIERVQKDARIPVIGHLEGVCHVYVHGDADLEMARDVVVNAKMRRTGICGATETLLIDRAIAKEYLPVIASALRDAGCNLRGDSEVCEILENCELATENDWCTEYLDAILSVRVVTDLAAAARHIEQYGSGHTEAIITGDKDAADEFFRSLDSAILLHNASTQFADGGEFGMGAEIGIATGRLHARGPVGAAQLTSYKYLVRGNGQTRP